MYKTKINHLGILEMFLNGKKTFGESENLRTLIFKNITETDFERIRKNDVIITVSNLNTMGVESKEAKDCTYYDFCEWIWASASLVRNALDLTTRVFSFMLNQIVTDDLIIGRLEGQNKKIKLNFYYPEEDLINNSLIFDPEQMQKFWDYGYLVGKKNNPECRVISMA